MSRKTEYLVNFFQEHIFQNSLDRIAENFNQFFINIDIENKYNIFLVE